MFRLFIRKKKHKFLDCLEKFRALAIILTDCTNNNIHCILFIGIAVLTLVERLDWMKTEISKPVTGFDQDSSWFGSK